MSQFDTYTNTLGQTSGTLSNAQLQANSFQALSGLSQGAANQNMNELSGTYKNLSNSLAGIAQPITDATNSAIQQNFSMGGQAATNAAKEYAARESQAGGTGAGAGVVKAQTMMGVLGQNAQLKMQAANTVAGIQSQGLSLQAQIAQQMAALRQSYASTLATYVTNQNAQAIQNRSIDVGAAQNILSSVHPTGSWAVNNQGQPMTTQDAQAMNAYNNQMAIRNNATSFLAGII